MLMRGSLLLDILQYYLHVALEVLIRQFKMVSKLRLFQLWNKGEVLIDMTVCWYHGRLALS